MEAPRKLIVGYDLGEEFTQISCYSYKSFEPIPISIREEEQTLIPTVLCVKTDTRQWLFGEEAVKCAEKGLGTRIDHLLDYLSSGNEIELFGETFHGVALMEKYLRKTLTVLKHYFPTEPITKLVITIQSTSAVLVEGIYTALEQLGLERDRVAILSHASAYLYYALSQDKALWTNDVGLFEFNKHGMYYFQIRMNRRAHPMIAGLSRTEFTHLLNYDMLLKKQDNLSYTLNNIASMALHKQLVTTLYFTGSGFEGGWADEAIKVLCAGRRAFMGQNLFTKGACYAAKELSGDAVLGDFILLNDDMILNSVGIRVYKDTKFQEVLLAEAGEVWYEINRSIEVIPEGEAELEIILKNIMSRETVREKIHLTKLPSRPDRMTRLEINLTCRDKSTGMIRINDLGFGEIYPGTGCILELLIEM